MATLPSRRSSRLKVSSRSSPRRPDRTDCPAENEKPGSPPGFFVWSSREGLSGDAELRDLDADLRKRGGDLARLRQHEEIARAAGTGRQHCRLAGTVGIDLDRIDRHAA